MTRSLPLLAGLALVAGAGLVQGLWTQRWQKSADLDVAVARLEQAPGDLGAWKAEPAEVEADALAAAGAFGSKVRRYTDARSGASVLVILLCGPSGKMSVHRPEHCYRSAGYEMMGQPARHEVAGASGHGGDLWTARFHKEAATGPVQLRIFWTWFGDGAWRAPESPRLAFAHLPALYKLYVVRELPPRGERFEDDPCLDLLRLLLPALGRALGRPWDRPAVFSAVLAMPSEAC